MPNTLPTRRGPSTALRVTLIGFGIYRERVPSTSRSKPVARTPRLLFFRPCPIYDAPQTTAVSQSHFSPFPRAKNSLRPRISPSIVPLPASGA